MDRQSLLSKALLLVAINIILSSTYAFVTFHRSSFGGFGCSSGIKTDHQYVELRSQSTDDHQGSSSSSDVDNIPTEDLIGDSSAAHAPWERELFYCTNRIRLEEQWTQRFKKSGPVFLSYDRCRSWAAGQNMWESKKEWYDWIQMGEKNASIVPSDPETFYRKCGTWVSWDDFLGMKH